MKNILNNIQAVVRAGAVALTLATACYVMPDATAQRLSEYNPHGAYETNDSTGTNNDALFKSLGNLSHSHFTWGAEAGTSIDLTAHDMSTFDVDVLLGYKNSFLNMAGVGVGIHRTIHTGDNFIPIYATLRSSFRPGRSLMFMNMRFGYSFNTIGDSPTFGDFNAAIGVGFNLSQSRRARTYILLNLAYRHFNERNKNMISLDTSYVYIAQLLFGVNF